MDQKDDLANLFEALQARVHVMELAQDKAEHAHKQFWLFFGAALVFYMQCGFALLEAGSLRSKTTQNILLKNLVDACLGGLLWYSVGYALSSPGGSSSFIGTRWTALYGEADWARWLFSWAFAATAATIVSGAVAERCDFRAYLSYTVVLTVFVVRFGHPDISIGI
uniref:Ammonium transporter n=1 Tax=Tetraselmis sp. GSL018 TaxID=582737 RepID=A0A061SBE6_9CHLO|mmetsp:Transcript_19713/g.47067  ORF Transcript_19713/g.47067 Transcript_19713/m.47067 type:complete len:166 (+) Transcript_19713:243-740(+)|eukprot:CAMPEP_0177595502 /NCGR_PEP_ID=MMETSP0419_2-20121207/10401_1 /TAXON_ID=582737 /ORGANISM="Tetraselmis sp., Strain GSL018" /LENGTH=165 /DNA_ID=CAMNT_0019086987 /DNA_START=222 /DNA_END=719 /DNA_ORIENTATION=-